MGNNTNYNPYGSETEKQQLIENMEKSAFAQYVTAGTTMHMNESKRRIDIKEFRRTYDEDGFKKKIFIAAIIAYIVIAFNVITSVLFNLIGLIDCAILAALVIGIHKNKSKGCVIGLLAYAIINWLVVFIATSNLFSGWIWITISIFLLFMFNKADKAYKQIYG